MGTDRVEMETNYEEMHMGEICLMTQGAVNVVRNFCFRSYEQSGIAVLRQEY